MGKATARILFIHIHGPSKKRQISHPLLQKTGTPAQCRKLHLDRQGKYSASKRHRPQPQQQRPPPFIDINKHINTTTSWDAILFNRRDRGRRPFHSRLLLSSGYDIKKPKSPTTWGKKTLEDQTKTQAKLEQQGKKIRT